MNTNQPEVQELPSNINYVSSAVNQQSHLAQKQLNYGLLTQDSALCNPILINPNPRNLEYKPITEGTFHPNCQKKKIYQLSEAVKQLSNLILKTAKFDHFTLK